MELLVGYQASQQWSPVWSLRESCSGLSLGLALSQKKVLYQPPCPSKVWALQKGGKWADSKSFLAPQSFENPLIPPQEWERQNLHSSLCPLLPCSLSSQSFCQKAFITIIVWHRDRVLFPNWGRFVHSRGHLARSGDVCDVSTEGQGATGI